MTCISSVKFNMFATIASGYQDQAIKSQISGEYKSVYDPLTGNETTVLVETDYVPNAVGVQSQIPCYIKVNYVVEKDNTTEYRGTRVVDTETLTMRVPSKYKLKTVDVVMAIHGRNGTDLVFEDDQYPDPRPTQYNIVGVSPVFDPFGRTIEYQALLKKVNG